MFPVALKIGSTHRRHGYLRGFPLWRGGLVDIFFLHSLRVVIAECTVEKSAHAPPEISRKVRALTVP